MYSWAHILLFARMCRPRQGNITAEWVKLMEEHHASTFPFTLWPLSYRTSSIISSSAIESPILLSSVVLKVPFEVGLYTCNEVVVVCVKKNNNSDPCPESGIQEHMMDRFLKIKDKTMSALNGILCHDQGDEIKRIVCTGYRECSFLASCLSKEIVDLYDEEKEFMGLNKRRVNVEYIGFSDPLYTNRAYWKDFVHKIDNELTIGFIGDTRNGLNSDLLSEIKLGRDPKPSLRHWDTGLHHKKSLRNIFRRVSADEKPSVSNHQINLDVYIEEIIKLLKPT